MRRKNIFKILPTFPLGRSLYKQRGKEKLCDNFRGTTYTKVNYPFAPYDVMDAYYKKANHKVDYNSGNYVTDSIYERKFLNGTDQYATYLNSNACL